MTIKESLESGTRVSIDRATQLLGVSRCGFYKWLRRPEEEPVKSKDIGVRNELQKVAVEFPAYGYRRITAELRNRGLYGQPQTCAEAYARRESPLRSEEVQAQDH